MVHKIKQKKKLELALRRRARRPDPTFQAAKPLKASNSCQQRMVRDHLDVLQNIEFSLVETSQQIEKFDDRDIEQVLRRTIQSTAPDDPVIEEGIDHLKAARAMRDDISDDVWQDGLRVAFASLKRHSQCQPFETSYLRFIEQFMR